MSGELIPSDYQINVKLDPMTMLFFAALVVVILWRKKA